jgi:hypothetical protein
LAEVSDLGVDSAQPVIAEVGAKPRDLRFRQESFLIRGQLRIASVSGSA